MIAQHLPEVGLRPNLWETEGYAAQWGLDPAHLGEQQTDQLLEGEAANLPLPSKEVILEYTRRTFANAEEVAVIVDELFMSLEQADEKTRKTILGARRAIIDFMNHDNRHLGMMECLKGIMTGKGTATV